MHTQTRTNTLLSMSNTLFPLVFRKGRRQHPLLRVDQPGGLLPLPQRLPLEHAAEGRREHAEAGGGHRSRGARRVLPTDPRLHTAGSDVGEWPVGSLHSLCLFASL